MYEYDEECLKTFLKKQGQLFDEPVAETLEEQRYCILTEDGDLLGTLWEEDGNGYFQKE